MNSSPKINQEADDWKKRGNKLFQDERFEEARACYSNAISLNSNEASYFTNRALCELRLTRWDSAASDCRKALELDNDNIKANYHLGSALHHVGRYEEALVVLNRANEVAKRQNMFYGDDIARLVRFVRREKLQCDEEKRLDQEIELQSYVNSLINNDIKRKISEQKRSADNANATQEEIDLIKREGEMKKEALNNLFAQVDDRRKTREIPDYFCGRIGLDLLADPVITPCGITYERSEIMAHLERVGHFDPVSRSSLTADQLITNHALREAVEQYKRENEWALNYFQ